MWEPIHIIQWLHVDFLMHNVVDVFIEKVTVITVCNSGVRLGCQINDPRTCMVFGTLRIDTPIHACALW
jgi:hypothetical protein